MHAPSFARLATASVALAGVAPAQLTWHLSTDRVSARSGHCGFFDQSRGRISVIAGNSGGIFPGDCWQLHDGSEWVKVSGITLPRANGAICPDVGNGNHWILFGGTDAGGTLYDDTLRFDPHTLSFTTVPQGAPPPARWHTAMAFDSTRQRAVMFGGGSTFGYWGDTWEWDGATWTERVVPGPGRRDHHAMAFHAAQNRTVLFGGFFGATLGDTWLWNGNSWLQANPRNTPPPVHGAALAYDSRRQRTVLFGGRDDTGTASDSTWEWNGVDWRQIVLPVRPPARDLASLTHDEHRQRLVLVGGTDQNGAPLDDAWAYDGTEWTRIEPNDRGTLVEPPARRDATFVYDVHSNRTVLFGGTAPQGFFWQPLTDTWESAGRDWQQRYPVHHPPASFGGAGTRNRGTGGVVHFPGEDVFGAMFNDLWIWDGTDWIQRPLSSFPLADFRHQTVASLQNPVWGWVFVRRVTTGTGLSWNSTVQMIVPSSGTAFPPILSGGPPATEGSVFAQTADSSEPNRVFLYGGAHAALTGGEIFHGDVWELAATGAGAAMAWTALTPAMGSPVPPARRDAAVTMIPAVNQLHGPLVYVAGGRGANGALADAWVFDVTTRVWSPWPVAATFTPRYGASATFDTGVLGTSPVVSPLLFAAYYAEGYAGAAVVFGGSDGSSARGEIFDSHDYIGTSVQRQTRSAPGIGTALLVHDRSAQRTLLLDDKLRTMWSFDGAVWRPVVGKGPIPALWRSQPSFGTHVQACFDESIGEMVLHGSGQTWSFSLATETWTYRGSGGPSGLGLYDAKLVYVPSMQQNLSFGGSAQVFPTSETWTFDSATNQWTRLATMGPSARTRHGMACDRLRNRVVLHGGIGFGPTVYDDTWEYVPTTGWQQRLSANAPPARHGHTMVYDEARARTVVCGGLDPAGNGLHDVREWDGSVWTQRTPENPVTSTGMMSDWDATRERIVSATLAPLSLTEISARIDVGGAGNSASTESIRYYSQPQLGSPLRLGFANPLGTAIHMLGIGPVQQGTQLSASFLCEPANLYSILVAELASGVAEPNVVWNVPNSPSAIGLTVVVQALVRQPAGCWRATSALHVRF